MKKLLLPLILLFASCGGIIDTSRVEVIKGDAIDYFKDPKTGLCFAYFESPTYCAYTVTSITCVPCDSLTRLQTIKNNK